VGDVDALFTTIRGRDPGELVTIVVIRRGERAELPATLAERR
jgi:S1-C subfamily serine protease